MKQIVLMVFIVLVCSGFLLADITDYYEFVPGTATYTEITGTAATDAQGDDAISAPIDIGFAFPYGDNTYTQIKICSNGYITLGTTPGQTLANNLTSTTYCPVVAPLWDDLHTGRVADGTYPQTSSVQYLLQGTAPNRTFTVQYQNAYWYYSVADSWVNFQVVLHENGNIDIVYGTNAGTSPGTSASASVGINMLPGGTTNFLSVDPLTSTASNTTENIVSAYIPNGTKYSFNVPIPVPNDLQALSITGDLTPTSGTATTFDIQVRNRGTAAQSTYTVKLMSGTTELTSVAGPAIQPNEILTVTVTHTFTATGPVTVFGRVVLTGDQNPNNDDSPPLNLNVQASGTVAVTIGAGDLNERHPLDFYWKNSLYECIYLASEINMGGLITGIAFYNNFVTNEPNGATKLWLGETTNTDLAADWIPSTQLTQVFDGIVTYPSGQNTITITFATPYVYGGGNLVLMANRPMDTQYYSSSDDFLCQDGGANRARNLYSDTTTYDPANPPTATPITYFPKTTLYFVVSGMGALEGTVTSGGNPLDGALLHIVDTQLNYTTTATGTYSFPFVQAGNYQVTCSKLGYVTQTQNVTIIEDQTATLNFVMVPSPVVNVTGTVVGSDAPTVGLADATVSLTGVLDYEGTTNASGQFTIVGVLAGNTYNISIHKDGYQNATGTITIGTTDYDIGTQVLSELTNPPHQVLATPNPDHTQILVNWRAPGATGPGYFFDFESDDGGWTPSSDWTNPLGDWQWTDEYDPNNYTDIDTYVDEPPTSAHSGTGMWGTVIQGGYSNCGGWSYLRQTFDCTGMDDLVLNMWHYMDGYNTWDYGLILVNGNTVWGVDSAAEFMPWQVLNVDLSAYSGMSNVQISFEWYATSVVSYSGWYIDDLYIGPASDIPDTRAMITDITPSRSIDRSLLGFKVWRLLDGEEDNEPSWTLLTANTITDTFYVNANWQSVPDGLYKWAVKSVYTNDILSNPAFSNTVLKHAVVNVSGTVHGSDAPTTGLEGAEVTLTGMADYSAITDANGQFTIPGVYNLETYQYTITHPGYQNASGTIDVGIGDYDMGNITLNEIAIPASGVNAVEAAPNVNITWMQPGTGGGEWIQWDDDTNNDSIGLTAGGTFDVASRWPVADLTDYVGQSLYAIKFWPGDTATYSLRVWTGGDASAPGTLVVDQPYTGYTVDEFNTVVLDTPVMIEADQELWFGFSTTHTSGAYPAGCDDGPAHNGLGNMIYNAGAWDTLYNLASSLNYDWNLAGYVGYSAPTSVERLARLKPLPIDETRYTGGEFSARGYKTRTGESDHKIINSRSLEGYKVWRLLQGQEGDQNLWTQLTPNTITATAYQDVGWSSVPDGNYKWAVKAVYTGDVLSVPAFSNAVQKLTQIGTIAGIVRQTNNTPIMGATISVGTATATSNATGAYSLQCPAGTHTVACSAPGFETGIQVGVVVITGQTTQVNFVLAPSAIVLEESFEGDTFPPTGWTQIITDTGAANTYGVTPTWCRVGNIALTPAITPPDGTWQAAMWWSYNHQDEWLITPQFNCPVDATLSFHGYIYLGSTNDDHYYVKVSTDDGATWTVLWDAVAVGGDAYSDYTVPFVLDLAPYANQQIKLAWHADDPDATSDGMWNVAAIDNVVVEGTTANEDPVVPVITTALHGNYPNPFNPKTTISYSVKGTSPVTVEIYNTKGQKVKTLVSETKGEGNYNVTWDGTDNNNRKVTSGVYFYRMTSGKYTSSRKMVLMK